MAITTIQEARKEFEEVVLPIHPRWCMIIENIEQARREFAEVVLPIHPRWCMIMDYIASCREMLVVFDAKRHLPLHARSCRLKIQAAEEYLNKSK